MEPAARCERRRSAGQVTDGTQQSNVNASAAEVRERERERDRSRSGS